MRGIRGGALTALSAIVLAVAGAPAASANPVPTVDLGLHNGYCSTTWVTAPADTPFNIRVDTAFLFTDTANLRIPSLNIRVILPSAYFNPVAWVAIDPQPPGPIPFELMTPTVSGSAGKGCWGTIQVG
ncbi:hypothetical protein AB0N05_33490 [Nocardia sp. NPDC051030]|uniref:hypothetical protein n=1 Tax=Nocardia sp. NPDC051030 TaxID=3155162 RepID=UPI0034209654